jgi:Na+-driven multidrug efflux pump
VCILILAIVFRSFFAGIFANDPYIIGLAADVVIILALLLPIQTSQIVMGGSLRGAGDTRYVAITMLLTVTLIRPGLSALFIYGFGWGLHGAWYAIFVDQIVRLVLLFTRFSRGKWISISV